MLSTAKHEERIAMTRETFTLRIAKLIVEMVDEGERPTLDYALRSLEEQQRLFAAKKSKCDGITKPSAHQLGKAVDIYFTDGAKLVEPRKGYAYWHDVWVGMGGRPGLDWDQGHYEAGS